MRAQTATKTVKSRAKNAILAKKSKHGTRAGKATKQVSSAVKAKTVGSRVWPKLMATAAALGLSGAAYAYYRRRASNADISTSGGEASTEATTARADEMTDSNLNKDVDDYITS